MGSVPDHRAPRARPAPEVRADILTAARELFRQRGYQSVTLTDVGAAVGLTRGAVLYHYHSKAEVLTALVAPFIADLDEMLDDFESAPRRPLPSEVLARLLDVLLSTRAADLLLRDISVRHALALEAWATTQSGRLIDLLVADGAADGTTRIRSMAALGAVARPLVSLPDPLPELHRDAILAAATNLRPPRRRAASRAVAS